MAVFDATSDPRISYSDAARAEGVKSILVAPIPIRGKMRGVLRLLTRHHREFKSDELEFAAALADQCGIAIQNAISYQRIAKLVIELEHQEDFLQRVMDSLDEELFVLDARYRITMVNRTFVKNHRLEMAGAAAHELNSPLFAALGTAQMALAESGASDPRYRDIETVISNLKVVTELTQKMGRITRYESKDYAGDVKIVDIRKASRPLGDTGD